MHKYDSEIIRTIKLLYILAGFLWVIIFFWLKSYIDGFVVWVFLFIPIFVFSFNFLCVDGIDNNIEQCMCRGNYLSLCLLTVDIFLNWNRSLDVNDTFIFFRILLVAFIFIVLSLIDLWVPIKQISIVKHVKSIFQTIAISLLCFSLCAYYTNYENITC